MELNESNHDYPLPIILLIYQEHDMHNKKYVEREIETNFKLPNQSLKSFQPTQSKLTLAFPFIPSLFNQQNET